MKILPSCDDLLQMSLSLGYETIVPSDDYLHSLHIFCRDPVWDRGTILHVGIVFLFYSCMWYYMGDLDVDMLDCIGWFWCKLKVSGCWFEKYLDACRRHSDTKWRNSDGFSGIRMPVLAKNVMSIRIHFEVSGYPLEAFGYLLCPKIRWKV